MDLLPGNGELVERYAGEIAELVWSTGPISPVVVTSPYFSINLSHRCA